MKQCKHINGENSIYSNRTVTYMVIYFNVTVIYCNTIVAYSQKTVRSGTDRTGICISKSGSHLIAIINTMCKICEHNNLENNRSCEHDFGIVNGQEKNIPENNWKVFEYNRLKPMHKLTNHNYYFKK